ncbi:MAG TPA: glycosyltransferase family 2 protein [Candidatus Saccharimonadales bacterium]|nr:glycosyltransferase family 2 protein [Candidatus Saccharimonadales bacterium]
MVAPESQPNSPEPMFLSVVMPAYNEAGSLEAVIEDHLRVIRGLPGAVTDWEIVVIDDASTDDTPRILAELARREPRLRVERHPANQGIFRSFEDAHRTARGTHVFSTGSDGQWPAENLARLFQVLRASGADLVCGVRPDRFRTYTPWRRFISASFALLPRLLFQVEVRDPGSIKLGRREVFQMELRSRSVFNEAERIIVACRRGLRVEFAPVEFLPRRTGKALGAKMSNVVGSARDCLRCFWFYRVRGGGRDARRGGSLKGKPE